MTSVAAIAKLVPLPGAFGCFAIGGFTGIDIAASFAGGASGVGPGAGTGSGPGAATGGSCGAAGAAVLGGSAGFGGGTMSIAGAGGMSFCGAGFGSSILPSIVARSRQRIFFTLVLDQPFGFQLL
jgi:hypothetical protein